MNRNKLVWFLMEAIVTMGMVMIGLDLISAPSTAWNILGIVVFAMPLVYFFPRIVKAWNTYTSFALLLVGLMVLGGTGCGFSRIEPGHRGVIVHLYGSSKGVDIEPAGVGMVWYNPFTTSVYEFPVFVQTASWTQSATEGSPTNEEVSFNTKEGMVITADISLSYSLIPDRVPDFFAKFRTDKLYTFTHGFLRNIARDAFNEVGPHYSVEEAYGERKEELVRAVRAKINAQTEAYGVLVEQFGFIGSVRLPETVVGAINAKMTATQSAIKVENELRSAEAEAKKSVATANGAAQARLAIARAEAEANLVIAKSLTTELIQWQMVQKWNGQRPMVEGGAGTGLMLQVPLPVAK